MDDRIPLQEARSLRIAGTFASRQSAAVVGVRRSAAIGRRVRYTRHIFARGHCVATIVNLNQHRKKRERADEERRAAENRVRFGRSKEERSKDLRESARTRKELDDKRLE